MTCHKNMPKMIRFSYFRLEIRKSSRVEKVTVLGSALARCLKIGRNQVFLKKNGCLSLGNCTQCGNFMIFPLLRFYVKSICGILEVYNLPF